MKNSQSVSKIQVFKNENLVGVLSRTVKGSQFDFSKEVINDPLQSQVTYRITASEKPLVTEGVNLHPYFAGLLPEGLRLNALIKNLKSSKDDLFSLLAAAGNEPVGDLHFKVVGALQTKKKVSRPFSTDHFSEIKKEILKSGESLNQPVSGVQNKISGDRITLPLNPGIKSRTKQFILKFDSKELPDLVENEFCSLKLAKACGLSVNEATLIKDAAEEKALLVTRFDRQWDKNQEKFIRFHQEDACQFLDFYPADKYNLSFQEIAKGLHELCASPQIEVLNLLKLAAFSYLIGNGDLHGKNISLQKESNFGPSHLTVVYDMVCTYIYGDQQMALDLDGKKDNWKRKLLVDFGKRHGVPAVSTEKMLDQLIKNFSKHKDILWKVPFIESKKTSLESMIKKRLHHLG